MNTNITISPFNLLYRNSYDRRNYDGCEDVEDEVEE